jgi:hypothetical protein
MDRVNPYEAPRHAGIESPQSTESQPWGVRGRLALWSAVCAANMIVPLLFGLSMTEAGGRLGMAYGMATLYFAGCVMCIRFWPVGRILVVGGILVAASQLIPILHLMAGAMAFGIAEEMGQVTSDVDGLPDGLATAWSGYFVTVLTGGALVAAAFVAGAAMRVLTPGRWWRTDAFVTTRSKGERGASAP